MKISFYKDVINCGNKMRYRKHTREKLENDSLYLAASFNFMIFDSLSGTSKLFTSFRHLLLMQKKAFPVLGFSKTHWLPFLL
jgi:hypothetical protein